ncbi:MAG: hypothetical protein ACI85O_000945 [Saprospiraceae bacterium]|jgi:hypothetical protein
MSKIHALLVGINEYAAPKISSLKGCVNDITNFQDYLTDSYKNRLIEPQILLNEQATRQNIIDGFRNHLSAKVKKGDIALFYFAGHGSRENSPLEFREYEPEGKNETLVCYDSRQPDCYDLADRELGFLIDELAQHGAQVVTILDCCHSGSGTRSMTDLEMGAPRFAADDKRGRTLDSYLDGKFTTASEVIKNPPHILLAACDKTEKAYELQNNNGHFSYQLLRILKEKNSEVNYADLFEECRLKMRRISKDQHPQFESQGFFNAYNNFLQSTGDKSGAAFKVSYYDGEWHVNAGAVHHIPTDRGRSAEFEVLDAEGKFIDYAITTGVQPAESVLSFTHGDKTAVLDAKLISLPTPPLTIALISPFQSINKDFLAAKKAFQPLYFDLEETSDQTQYCIKIEDNQTFQIIDNQLNTIIRTVEGNDYSAIFQDLLEHTEKIARWEKSMLLDNKNTRLDRSDVQLILTELDEDGSVQTKHKEAEVALDLYDFNGIAQQQIRLEVRNNHPRQLYGALFYMSSRYGMTPVFNDTLPAKKTKIVFDKTPKGNPLRVILKDSKKKGFDCYKLFISTTKIPDQLLRQRFFKQGETVDYWGNKGAEDTLRGGRDLDEFDDIDLQAEENDWFAKTMKVETRLHEAAIGKNAETFADGLITIQGHADFSGDVVFSSTDTSSRSLSDMSILADFANKNNCELLLLAPNSRSISALNTLEISNIKNKTSLKEKPLILEINQPLNENEGILPVTFDGEFILPFGDLEQTEDGKTIIKIHDIPKSSVSGRSIGGAIKMAFLKLAFKKETANLRWVEYSESELSQNTDGIVNKVDEAENILVCIHGIIGDTNQQAEFARAFHNKIPTTEQAHDLVLTFDYENLNTPIENIAANFKKALEDAGITENSGKKITILSHSMGGLVSRYFIEVLNGKKVVQHLIMAGTPNEGSRIGKVPNSRDKMLTLLGFALNFIGQIPFAGKIVKVLDGSKKVTVTLEQMDWEDDSNFLKNLAKSEDPGVPYTIIAGDMGKFMKENPKAKGLMNKMIKLGGRAFYGRQKNDLAVSMASVKSISSKRTPKPVKLDAVCHHMNYFTDGEVERAF